MDRLDAMRVFVRVAEQCSFSATAEEFGLPRSTVSEAIKQLEARLGVPLLQRTTRMVKPTLDGEAYLQRCRRILADVEDAEQAFSGGLPSGVLRVDVQGSLARHFLLPHLPAFLQRYPDVQIFMSETDRFIDPVRDGIDCVLRVGTLQDSDLIARQVALLDEATLASPAYLQDHPPLRTLEDLSGHQMVGFHSSASGGLLPLEFTVQGKVRTLTLPARVSVTAAESYVAAAIQGFGLIQIPRYHATRAITARDLAEVLSDVPPTPSPVSVLYPRSRQLSPRVRVFIDWIASLF